MSKKIVPAFNPDAPAAAGSLFGLPYTVDNARVVALPIPWDATVSYKSGASKGPAAIVNASCQVDLFDENIMDAWKTGIAMDAFPKDFEKMNTALRKKVEIYLDAFVDGKADTKAMKDIKDEVNRKCDELRKWIRERSLYFLKKDKVVALIGGDHSTPLGLMEAVSERCRSFGILHIDAHCDLRNAYEGFIFSHASIMFNALKIKNMERLVQVGIRDFSEGEKKIIDNSKGRVRLFSDKSMKEKMYSGSTWKQIVKSIVEQLPDNVYLSFDIDGLDPKLCPNTGTPVPGGLEFQQAIYLIEQVIESGKKIISFDINEVAPGNDEWDANVGARLLYKISNLAALSQV